MKASELKIRRVIARPVLVPMMLPLQTATGLVDRAPLVLIDVETGAGITGRAYLFAIGRHNLSPIVELVRAMGELVTGDVVAPFEIEKKLRAKYALLGVHNIVLFAMAGIDMAAWDTLGHAAGQPVTRLLGGVPRPVRAYNSKGLGIMAVPKLVNEARQLVDEGFEAVKLRLGRPEAEGDIAAIRAVKRAIGPKVTLMCDFNQALTVTEAIRRGRMIDDEGAMYWIEEPIRADDFAGCARVADEVVTPIQIGENFMGPQQMAQALAAHCCDFVMPDLQRIGGVTGWMRAAALAQSAGIEMSSHLFSEVSAQLLAVTPTCHWLEYVDWANPILEDPIAVQGGFVLSSEKPGLGMRWDEKAVKKYLA